MRTEITHLNPVGVHNSIVYVKQYFSWISHFYIFLQQTNAA